MIMNSAPCRCSHGGAGRRIGKNVAFKFLYGEVPRLPPVLPWGSWQEVAGAGSQGTEPRSMIWDGTLTDSIRKMCLPTDFAYLTSQGHAGRSLLFSVCTTLTCWTPQGTWGSSIACFSGILACPTACFWDIACLH